jgi:hypothetical protein
VPILHVGPIMSATKRVAGEAGPPAVREILEAVANDDIDQEFAIGLFNRRGVATRMPADGAAQQVLDTANAQVPDLERQIGRARSWARAASVSLRSLPKKSSWKAASAVSARKFDFD